MYNGLRVRMGIHKGDPLCNLYVPQQTILLNLMINSNHAF